MPKIPSNKLKKFYYRRASWGNAKNHQTLETLLRNAHMTYSTVAKRTFKLGSGAEIKCANYSDKKGSHLLLQLASYVPDQPTSTISKNNKTSSSSIQAEPAPNGKDYLDGDVFVLVNDNHVILCLSGVRDSVVDIYFRKILNKSKTKIETFTLDKVANISKVKMIQEQGVKELCLGASLYDASIEELDNKNLTMFGLTHSVAEQIKRIFAADRSCHFLV